MTIDERVETGTKLLLRAALIALGLWFLYLIRDVVLLTVFAVLSAAALAPLIGRLTRHGLSRTASVIIVYAVIFLGGLALLIAFLPVLFSEIKEFLSNWPLYAERIGGALSGMEAYFQSIGIGFEKEAFFQNIEQSVTETVGNLFSTTISLFQGFIHFIGFFFLSLYLSLEERGIEQFFLLLTPEHYHKHALSIVSRMREKASQWLFGQTLLILIAFGMYAIGLSVIGIPYALAIAVFGALMEILPYIGPVLAAIPAVLSGLFVSPGLAIAAAVFYVIAHQLEAHVIAPQVMKRSAALNPVAFIIAVLVGAQLGGPLGIILAVPITMMMTVFVDDLLVRRSS